MTTATATATDATATTAKATRNRKPSPFAPVTRVTFAVHGDVDNAGFLPTALGTMLSETFGEYSVRTVSRTRTAKGGKAKAASGPASLMVYIAPEGYKYAATTERGIRLDSETANLLRGVAESMGLDPNDSASIIAVAKALAAKATAK